VIHHRFAPPGPAAAALAAAVFLMTAGVVPAPAAATEATAPEPRDAAYLRATLRPAGGAPFAVPLPPHRPEPPPLPAALTMPAPRGCNGEPMLGFVSETVPDSEIVIAFVGDVLLHGSLQRQAFAHPEGFRSLWAEVEDILQGADLAYANLEGPIAEGVDKRGGLAAAPVEHFDDWVYSSYPMFNYHPALAPALRAAGIDVVSTANNHSLDRFAVGADRTLAAVQAAGLAHTGTRPSDRPDAPWHAVTRAGPHRIAWLACTYGTNGIPDRERQVLLCFEQQDEVLAAIARLSADPAIDAVILTPHWGNEYWHDPTAQQRTLAHAAIAAGATAVVGSHPHVVQPWERHVTAGGREGFVLYSLGNFVSGQRELPRRTSIILLLGLAETPDGGLTVAGARYVPIRFNFQGRNGRPLTVQALDRLGAGADSLALLARLLEPANLHAADAPLTTLTHCGGPADRAALPAPAGVLTVGQAE
jgi:poly-gamma-glutamate synthesis protein (capsule biosynthesis protein)